MGSRPFSNADPFLQLIVLFLIMFVSVALVLVMGQGLISLLWGIDIMTQQDALMDFSNPQIIHVNRILLLFQHLGLFIIPAIIFAKLISFDWKDTLGFRNTPTKLLAASAAIIVCCLPMINALAWINEMIAFPEFLVGLEAVLSSMEEGAARLTEAITKVDDVPSFLFNVLVVALIPALGEEMVFRGLVLPILHKWTGKLHAAVWISALLFSAMHLQFYGFLPRLVLGALLGYLFVYSRSLWAPIVAHFVNNALALVLLFLMARGEITADLDTFEVQASDLVTLFVSLALVGSIMYFIIRNRSLPPAVNLDTDTSGQNKTGPEESDPV